MSRCVGVCVCVCVCVMMMNMIIITLVVMRAAIPGLVGLVLHWLASGGADLLVTSHWLFQMLLAFW